MDNKNYELDNASFLLNILVKNQHYITSTGKS